VLDLVEVRGLAEEREELVLPRVAENRAELADRLDVRVAREDLLDRERVVRIGEECLLLGLAPPVELRPRHRRIGVECRFQRGPVPREAGVVDLRGVAVLHVPHVLLQQGIPRRVRVIELRERGRRRKGEKDEREAGKAAHARSQSSPWAGAVS
jgi:hypothetical protein